jgi:hypothetical protein
MKPPKHMPIAVGLVVDLADPTMMEKVRAEVASDARRLLEIAVETDFAFVVIAGNPTREGRSRVVLARDEITLMAAVAAGFDFIDAQARNGGTSAWVMSKSIEPIVRPLLAAMQPTVGPMQ